jgi:hypothetical protein
MNMSGRIHISAAAMQLTNKLFTDTMLEGCVAVGGDSLEVSVYGAWDRARLAQFEGYDISWREVA